MLHHSNIVRCIETVEFVVVILVWQSDCCYLGYVLEDSVASFAI